ncbi:MBL fold metallo-hydrolase [Microbulbifer litoralis]|uniref:MBL fold metallo-hydrolase n=1 Tax=Microbulbifer litoralis TaxID=2933965 RepID=UPI002027F1CC|nr:MBL fold metallo-hydrolase [Microbulbifer sp. GX H0434]
MPLEIAKTRIGDAEIIQIIEMDVGHHFDWFLPDNNPEAIRQITWLDEPYRTADYRLNGLSQSFIIKHAGRILVVDTCIGNDKTVDEIEEWNALQIDFLGQLERAGIDREKVTDVLCTHLHVDHVGWNTHLKDGLWLPTFANAKYHFARDEYDFWLDALKQDEEGSMQSASFHESVLPIAEAGLANFIDPPTDLGDGITVIPTPGHTRAHVAVVVDAGGERLVIAGDAIHHPCQIARPHWATVSDYDKDQSAATRVKLLGDLAGTPTLVADIHFNVPSFGRIEVAVGEDGFVFVPRKESH